MGCEVQGCRENARMLEFGVAPTVDSQGGE